MTSGVVGIPMAVYFVRTWEEKGRRNASTCGDDCV